MSNEHGSKNEAAWQSLVYEAWVARLGTPDAAARAIRADPRAKVAPLGAHLGDVAGKRVMNLMGSNGVKAVALALLGAEVTVVDFSAPNERYAAELAAAAGVRLCYLVRDVLQLTSAELRGDYDLVVAELGIVHYFVDLAPFMETVARCLAPGGRFVLRDFHPVSTKLLEFRGSTAKVRKHKVAGDYFGTELEERPAPCAKFLPPARAAEVGRVLWRKWTLGEVVTAVAAAGLVIRRLDEEPNRSSDVFDRGIPKTFTLVAERCGVREGLARTPT
jgi:2-polyprenyl-3-methyl-5-hydroxy-6-metoxy-1,4-benzoquinol methylase